MFLFPLTRHSPLHTSDIPREDRDDGLGIEPAKGSARRGSTWVGLACLSEQLQRSRKRYGWPVCRALRSWPPSPQQLAFRNFFFTTMDMVRNTPCQDRFPVSWRQPHDSMITGGRWLVTQRMRARYWITSAKAGKGSRHQLQGLLSS
jgi:hypothetical protein